MILKYFYKVYFYLNRIYRISCRFKKHEEFVWEDLKKLHKDAKWHCGIYELNKTIETTFEISENIGAVFFYMVEESCFHCRVKVLEHFSVESTSELFILASHFNNILSNGVVKIDVYNNYVEYHLKRELLIPLLYNSEIYNQILRHLNTSKDVYAAFRRLVEEGEAPAVIIADLLNQKKNNEEGTE